MSQANLIPPTFLFRYSLPLTRCRTIWTEKGTTLTRRHILPSFGELEGKKLFAELRGGWNKQGLAFRLEVIGKRQPPWCRSSRLEDSDGLHVWIDTRDTHSVHRATHFCHRFVFLPAGGGAREENPVAELSLINRSRAHPKPPPKGGLQVLGQIRRDGYVLDAHISADALTGWDAGEHPRLGFFYAVVDRERGLQTLSIGDDFKFDEDPSLWGTLELS